MRTAPLRPLSEYMSPAARPAPLLPCLLLAVTVIALAAMPLPWHHHDIPAEGYTIIYGIQGANWLVVIAAVCALFASRCFRIAPGFYAKWAISIIAFVVTLGMYADYLDSQDNAAQIFVRVYNGPGFYLGVALVPVILAAAVTAWRTALP